MKMRKTRNTAILQFLDNFLKNSHFLENYNE